MTKNFMYSDYCEDLLEEIGKPRKFFRYNSNPEIADVNIIVQNKVVEVTFSDGTKEKSVCREPDVFSLELAISICISKKIMGGSSAYNNAVKHGVKVYKDKLKKVKLNKEEQERIEKKRQRDRLIRNVELRKKKKSRERNRLKFRRKHISEQWNI